MKTLTLLLVAVVVGLSAGCSSLPSDKIELYGWLHENSGKHYLHLRISNKGQTPQTILTENYSMSSMDANGMRMPYIGLSYRLMSSSSGLKTASPENEGLKGLLEVSSLGRAR